MNFVYIFSLLVFDCAPSLTKQRCLTCGVRENAHLIRAYGGGPIRQFAALLYWLRAESAVRAAKQKSEAKSHSGISRHRHAGL